MPSRSNTGPNEEPPPHELTIRSRRGFDGKLVHVRVDDVRLPSSRESVREVVEHPGAVAIVPLTSDGRVLLIRQYRHAAGKSLLEIPAGTREPDESPAETARREVIEEIGHAPGRLIELATFYPSAGYSTERLTLFYADDCRPTEHAADLDEAIEIIAMPLEDIPHLLSPGTPVVEDAKTLIGLLWLLRQGAG